MADAGALVALGLVAIAPMALVVIVALLRGYTISIHLTRQNGNGRR